MNKLDDEVEIFHIDEEQKNMIIRLDNIKKLLDRNNKLQDEVNQLETNIDEAIECIKEFLCTEEYIKVDGKAIADNYEEILSKLERGKE